MMDPIEALANYDPLSAVKNGENSTALSGKVALKCSELDAKKNARLARLSTVADTLFGWIGKRYELRHSKSGAYFNAGFEPLTESEEKSSVIQVSLIWGELIWVTACVGSRDYNYNLSYKNRILTWSFLDRHFGEEFPERQHFIFNASYQSALKKFKDKFLDSIIEESAEYGIKL